MVILGRGLRVAVLLTGAIVALSPGAARAEGLLDFFSNAFGGQPAPSRVLPQPDEGFFDAPELTVRPRPRLKPRRPSAAAGSQRYNTADLKDVTIYTDKTLVRGDAVMTATGLKVYDGAPGILHTGDDFVAVADMQGLSKGMRNQLIAIDNASRPALAR